jgi:hypothetical protein
MLPSEGSEILRLAILSGGYHSAARRGRDFRVGSGAVDGICGSPAHFA